MARINNPKDPLVQINIRVPKSLKEQLDTLSANLDMTSSQIVRDLLRTLIASHAADEVSHG